MKVLKEVVLYKQWPCRIELTQYATGGRTAIRLLHAGEGDVVAVATINPLPGIQLGRDEVLIKDYSENDGMLDTLESAGIVKDTGKRVRMGFVDVPVCRLLVERGDDDA